MPNSEKFVRSPRVRVGAAVRAPTREGLLNAAAHVERDAAARHPALCGPDGETINAMSYGEQVVEALGEYMDAKINYAQAYQSVGAEWANPEPVSKAADVLTRLLDRKVKVRL